jgi:hypothetical protein
MRTSETSARAAESSTRATAMAAAERNAVRARADDDFMKGCGRKVKGERQNIPKKDGSRSSGRRL